MKDLNNCLDVVKNMINDYAELHDIRVCSECGHLMNEGYCIDDGAEYYCSEDCLHKNMTDTEFEFLYDNGNGSSYWTEWR